MNDTQRIQNGEWTRTFLIGLSLVITIVTFMIISSAALMGDNGAVDNGVVTTQVISLQPGDVYIQKTIATAIPVSVSPGKTLQNAF